MRKILFKLLVFLRIFVVSLLSADHFLAVECLGQGGKRRIENTSAKAKHKVEC